MRFADLAANLDQMEATSSRNDLVHILSDVYRACSVDELEPITYLIQGRLAPFFESVEIGLGERLLITAIAGAYSVPKEDVVCEVVARPALKVRAGSQPGHRFPAPGGSRRTRTEHLRVAI